MTKLGKRQQIARHAAEQDMARAALQKGKLTPEQWRELERVTWERGRREEAELLGLKENGDA